MSDQSSSPERPTKRHYAILAEVFHNLPTHCHITGISRQLMHLASKKPYKYRIFSQTFPQGENGNPSPILSATLTDLVYQDVIEPIQDSLNEVVIRKCALGRYSQERTHLTTAEKTILKTFAKEIRIG